jgi:hypothetical protein
MLYRPFLQYYSRQSLASGADERYFTLAMAGINVCRNIIHIGLEIRKQAVLIGPYWFITYTQFLAVLSLLSYVLNNPNQSGISEVFADAKLGRDCISGLTQRSLTADRVTTALNVSSNPPHLFFKFGECWCHLIGCSPYLTSSPTASDRQLRYLVKIMVFHQTTGKDNSGINRVIPPGTPL